jgi:hypothetical protein
VKVLIIPEDPTLDRFILKPIVKQIFAELGKSPWIDVLSSPRLRGVAQALDSSVLARIAAARPMFDLFLVLIDRDGDARRSGVAGQRELEHQGRLFICLAIEEIEVWMLAIHSKDLNLSWSQIRSEIHPKEQIAEPFLKEKVLKLNRGAARDWAMRELGAHWKGVLQRCPELKELQQRVKDWLEER